MKKVIFSLVTVATLSSVAYAGKNIVPAVIPPAPLPQKPITTEVIPPLGLYIGGGLTYVKSECQCNDNVKFSDGTTSRENSGKSYGVNLKGGYSFNEYLAFEAKYIYTPWGDKEKTLKHYGVYLKPTAPITENFDAYALIGYGKTKCETLNDSFKGVSWGLGTEYSLNKKKSGLKDGFSVYAEYLRPLKKSGSKNITTNTISGGVAYHF